MPTAPSPSAPPPPTDPAAGPTQRGYLITVNCRTPYADASGLVTDTVIKYLRERNQDYDGAIADAARSLEVYPGVADNYATIANQNVNVIFQDRNGKEIARQERKPLLFVEVNTGEEPQKRGVLPTETDAFLAACRDRYGLAISGLMCIPPFDEPPAPHFALTAKIARRNRLSLLSMGMSSDFPTAIALGATHVRVGTAIFGTRG